jgi:hypothetical protein
MTIKYATFVYMRGVLAVILLLAAHKYNASAPYWYPLRYLRVCVCVCVWT